MRASVGCQPSWDASDSPGCLTFLLALSKKKISMVVTLRRFDWNVLFYCYYKNVS